MANAAMARYHPPNGGKLMHSASPATIATLSWGSRSTTARPNRLSRNRASTNRSDSAGSSSSSVEESSAGSSSSTAGKMSVSSVALAQSRLRPTSAMDDCTPMHRLPALRQPTVEARQGGYPRALVGRPALHGIGRSAALELVGLPDRVG